MKEQMKTSKQAEPAAGEQALNEERIRWHAGDIGRQSTDGSGDYQFDHEEIVEFTEKMRSLATPAGEQAGAVVAGYWVRLVHPNGSSAWWHSSLRPDRHSAELIAEQWKDQLATLIGGAGGLQVAVSPVYLAAPGAAIAAREQEDAARYRELRDNSHPLTGRFDITEGDPPRHLYGEQLDAALAAGEEAKKE